MYQAIEKRLARFVNSGQSRLLRGGRIGLEKESLRVSPDGGIATTAHPAALGSALTHPFITTDYSEALTELITPPCSDASEALAFLRDAQKFVYDNLEGEFLWATSMPCVLPGADSIPIARYGSSNIGTMKTVYRRGLGHRYGRVMQVIAGVHFNYSPREAFWPLYQELEQDRGFTRAFVDDAYLGLIRNLQRYGWLIPYLFGASPAVCKSFLGGRPTRLDEFDAHTCFGPFATSLRMGDIGYTNRKEEGVGVKADYSDLEAYIASLVRAIETPCPQWQRIGVKVGNRYEQLNANILQIENEYYSTVRPKQVPDDNEKPTSALRRRGVRYVELRSLDVNAFEPLGVSESQARFLEAFMLFCLLQESPRIDACEGREIDENLVQTAHRGRDPALRLQRGGEAVSLPEWASELCDVMTGVCDLLDAGDADRPYSRALRQYRELVRDPDRTPSARILAEMRRRGEGFFHFARRISLEHKDYFDGLGLHRERRAFFEREAAASLERQAAIEASDTLSFDEFLEKYFSQD
ncbi:MAG TPA: glutamate--cysteine ligase [Sedimenticola sp.]|nr:glutamate--cysteine ligase [Sedimenticola sp.]